MSEWLYRTTPAGASLEDTRLLAEEFGFICRTAFTEGNEMKATITNVKKVGVGDLIHLYYVEGEEGEYLGTYRVVGPFQHPQRDNFVMGYAGPTKLVRARDDQPLGIKLAELGTFTKDPQFGQNTGWGVVKSAGNPPDYDDELFHKRNALTAWR